MEIQVLYKANGYSSTKCSKTGFVNGWDGQMNYRSDKDFITGTTSFHDNKKEWVKIIPIINYVYAADA